MTKREFYEAITALDNTELAQFAASEIVKMDAANAKRVAKNAEKSAEKFGEVREIVTFLGNEPRTASDVAALAGGEMKVQKVSALLRKAVNAGLAVSTDVKVKGKGTQKGYTLA